MFCYDKKTHAHGNVSLNCGMVVCYDLISIMVSHDNS